MTKRAFVEAALLVIGVYTIVGAVMSAVFTLLAFGRMFLWARDSELTPTSVGDVVLSSALPALIGAAVGITLLRCAARWSAALVAAETDAPAERSGAPLRIGLQLLGIYFCLAALPELPNAILESLHQDAYTRLSGSGNTYGPSPLDHTLAFTERWIAPITCVLQVLLGAFLALRADAIAARLERRNGAGLQPKPA